MRIRKNAKRSPLRSPASCPNAGENVQTHYCKLNQSPWGVMSFSLPVSAVPRRPPPLHQPSKVDKKEMIRAGKKSLVEDATRPIILCSKANGNGWQCQRKATNGNSLCDHHLSLIQTKKPVETHDHSSNKTKKPNETNLAKKPVNQTKKPIETHDHSSNQTKKLVETKLTKKPVNQTKKAVETHDLSLGKKEKPISPLGPDQFVETHDGSRGKKEKAILSYVLDQSVETHDGSRGKKEKAIPGSVPDEFYYYSGFGPRWGKVRGESSSSENINTRGEMSRNAEQGHGLSPALLSQSDDEDTESDDQIEVAAKVREKMRMRGRPPKKGQ